MNMNEGLLHEYDHEMANTRRTLERVPTDKLDYKPHSKSGTMGWLAGHVARMGEWLATTIQHDTLALDGMTSDPDPASAEELLEKFDKCTAEGREALAAASNETLLSNWSMTMGGKTLLDMPKITVIRGFVMNHMIHHRAQLALYLRLNDIPVPALYGPSADEGQMGEPLS
ncbi:MAG: DinB family protein [Bryobacteraceae bacterium]|nr:DinB family protein [Bryobacteraceae bacterium]